MIASWVITDDINLHLLVKIEFSRICHWKFTISPIPYSILWKLVTNSILHLREGQLSSTSWKEVIYIYYFEFYTEDLSLPCIYLFNHVFIWMWSHGHLFYSVGYNQILSLFIMFFKVQVLLTSPLSEFVTCPPHFPNIQIVPALPLWTVDSWAQTILYKTSLFSFIVFSIITEYVYMFTEYLLIDTKYRQTWRQMCLSTTR